MMVVIEGNRRRRRLFLLLLAVCLALLGTQVGTGRFEAAGSGTVRFQPDPKHAAYNGTGSFAVDLYAQTVASGTLCQYDPNNPQSPWVPCGVGGFETTITWDPSKLTYYSIAKNAAFLSSTGRTVNCFTPEVFSDHVHFTCYTTGTAPGTPPGPEGSGPLATIRFVPPFGDLGTSTFLTHVTKLTDIKGALIDHTDLEGEVQFSPCGDVTDNGNVNVFDATTEIARVGQRQGDPGWDPFFDVVPSGAINVFDVTFIINEIGQLCERVL
jgi:hypothetical protein